MTLRQEAYEKIDALSDNGIRLVIALANEILKQSNPVSDADAKRAAFLDAMNHKRMNPLQKDIDADKLREEAMIEKYGRFD